MFVGSTCIWIVALVFIDLAYSSPKLEKRNGLRSKSKRLWTRQGLAHSVENENTHSDISDNDNQGRYMMGYDTSDPDNDVEYRQQHEETSDISENIIDDDYMITDTLYNEEYGKGEVSEDYYEYQYNDIQKLNKKSRPMQVGDTFVAQEMLPIAIKLMKKVRDGNGKGKGIVSSAINPKMLADTLFERYFLSMKRVVILKDIDIDGLDALQALALSGEAVPKSAGNSITESPGNAKGEHISTNNPARKCHYRLLRKSINGDKIKYARNRNGLRRRVDLSKKLAKNRKLVVNPARRGPAVKNHKRKLQSKNRHQKIKKTSVRKNNTDYRGNARRAQNHKISNKRYAIRRNKGETKDACRWRYECTERTDLSTCRLQTDCSPEVRKAKNYIGLKLKDEEFTKAFKDFRRMVGVGVIDEEVEKILGKRFLLLRPKISNTGNVRVETLADYFNKLLIREQLDALAPQRLAGKVESDERFNEYDTGSGEVDEQQYSTFHTQDSDAASDEMNKEYGEAQAFSEDSGAAGDGMNTGNEDVAFPEHTDGGDGGIISENAETLLTQEDWGAASDEIKHENGELSDPEVYQNMEQDSNAEGLELKDITEEETLQASEEWGAAGDDIKSENEESRL